MGILAVARGTEGPVSSGLSYFASKNMFKLGIFQVLKVRKTAVGARNLEHIISNDERRTEASRLNLSQLQEYVCVCVCVSEPSPFSCETCANFT